MYPAEQELIRQLAGATDARFLYRSDFLPMPGCEVSDSLLAHLSPDDERRLRTMLSEGGGSADLTLLDFPFGNFAYVTAIPFFSDVYLALYPFKERRSRDALPTRLRAMATAIADAAGRRGGSDTLPGDVVSAMLTECMLLSEGGDEPDLAYYDLPAVLVRFAGMMAQYEKALDARVIADLPDVRFLAMQLSLPHFLKILVSLVSVLAHLSACRTIRLTMIPAGDDATLVRLSTDLPEALVSLGRTEDMLYVSTALHDAALPLLTAERIAAKCGYSLAAHADEATGQFSLSLRLSPGEGEIPDFRSRDQFASFDGLLLDAVRFTFGQRADGIISSREEAPE